MRIQRLTSVDRIIAGLRKAEAKMMHIVDGSQINGIIKPDRYNVRQADGSIKKITSYDYITLVETMQKIDGKYTRISRKIAGGNKTPNIK